jgi:hypothetical protein
MKTIAILFFSVSLTTVSFGQEKLNKTEAPVNVLQDEVQNIYELSVEADYKVFDHEGKLILEDHGKAIDFTEYEVGTYYVRYEGRVEQFKKLK